MRRLFCLALLVASPVVAGDRPLTLERLFAEPPLDGTLPREPKWLPDGKSFSFIEGAGSGKEATSTLWVEDASSGQRAAVLVDGDLAAFGEGEKKIKPSLARYRWSPDGKSLLLEGSGDLFLVTLPGKLLRRLTTTPAEEELATFSPDGKWIAYVRDNDLFTMELASGKELRISSDGSPERLNGKLDWVYTEEISERSAQAYAWSPDSHAIAYLTLDDAKVPTFPQVDLLKLHPKVDEQRYPKAGDPNPIVKLSVAGLIRRPDGGFEVRRSAVPWQSPGAEYLARFGWTPDGRVWFEALNREQTRLELVRVESDLGRLTTLLTETDPAWVNVEDDLHFLPDGSFLWGSERDGWRHLYLYAPDGRPMRQLTSGSWEVTRLDGVDEKTGAVFFSATEAGVLDRRLYRVRLEGNGLERLTEEPGNHRVEVSPDGRFILDTASRATQPPSIRLLSADGKELRVVAANGHPELEQYRLGAHEFVEVPGTGGITLHASLIKPPDFDPAKRYPVVVYVYGGPHSQLVQDSWQGRYGLLGQVMATKGFLVFSLDNRGTVGRGRAWERALLRRFGKVELEDQLAGVAWLKKQPWVDGGRIGIWGASYGGFMTCYALANAPGVFKAGVAIAAVTDWRFYDSIYTERYLKLPSENADGYRDSSPVNQAEELHDALLLIHGTADDNVHWQNTLELADRLTEAGKDYSLELYAGASHRSYEPYQRNDEMRRLLAFFESHLK